MLDHNGRSPGLVCANGMVFLHEPRYRDEGSHVASVKDATTPLVRGSTGLNDTVDLETISCA